MPFLNRHSNATINWCNGLLLRENLVFHIRRNVVLNKSSPRPEQRDKTQLAGVIEKDYFIVNIVLKKSSYYRLLIMDVILKNMNAKLVL